MNKICRVINNKLMLNPTVIGYGGLIMWAISAALVAGLGNLPVFQILTIALFLSFIFTVGVLNIFNRWHKLKQPLHVWIIGITSILGNDGAFKYAPPEQVDLINYLWPIMLVICSSFLPNEKLQWRYIVGAFIGFLGVAILLAGVAPTSKNRSTSKLTPSSG